VNIKPSKIARKWTKERLKRHPGLWEVEQETRFVECWPGEAAILIKNTTDGWSGWFPVKDIDITTSEGTIPS
jgi:hypothetical protein